MMKIIIALGILLILSEGSGRWLSARLHIQQSCYAAPIGTAAIFALSELFYMPVLLLQLSSAWTALITLIVFICCILVTLTVLRSTLRAFFQFRSIYLLAAGFLIFFLVAKYNPISLHDELLVQMITDSTAAHVRPQGLQGYELFGSMIMHFAGMDAGSLAVTLTLYASVISFALVLNIVAGFTIRNSIFRFTLILFSIFYQGFTVWHLVAGYAGSIWRLTFTAMALFAAYQWLKTGTEKRKLYIPIILMAGLFTDKGYLMVSVEIIYCLMVYLLHIQKIRALYDTFTFLFPVMIYLSALLGKSVPAAGWMLLVFYIIFMLNRSFKKTYRRIIKAENVLIAYNIRIFYVVIPAVFLIGTLVLRFFIPGYEIQYAYYIHYFSQHYVSGFLFPKGNLIDIVIDAVRWTGLFVFLFTGRSAENKMVKTIFLCMLIFFINPLCMGMLLKITGLDMYACAFEILFNPFTDILVFLSVYYLFEWTLIGRWVLEVILISAVLFGHLASYAGLNMGLYTDIIYPAAITQEAQYECL